MWTRAFWRGAAERALKTFFQTFVAVLIAGVGADAVGVSAGILQADWLTALSVAALATVSAPTGMGVRMAELTGLRLWGSCRGTQGILYSPGRGAAD